MSDEYDERPVQNDDGTWDALDAQGYGHVLGYATEGEAAAWLDGYHVGARENE